MKVCLFAKNSRILIRYAHFRILYFGNHFLRIFVIFLLKMFRSVIFTAMLLK